MPVRDEPPAELLTCPPRPAGFPRDASAQMPLAVREALIGIAGALAATRDQLARLVRWHDPAACSETP